MSRKTTRDEMPVTRSSKKMRMQSPPRTTVPDVTSGDNRNAAGVTSRVHLGDIAVPADSSTSPPDAPAPAQAPQPIVSSLTSVASPVPAEASAAELSGKTVSPSPEQSASVHASTVAVSTSVQNVPAATSLGNSITTTTPAGTLSTGDTSVAREQSILVSSLCDSAPQTGMDPATGLLDGAVNVGPAGNLGMAVAAATITSVLPHAAVSGLIAAVPQVLPEPKVIKHNVVAELMAPTAPRTSVPPNKGPYVLHATPGAGAASPPSPYTAISTPTLPVTHMPIQHTHPKSGSSIQPELRFIGIEYVPQDVMHRLLNIARVREASANRYALVTLPRASDWGRTPHTEKVLCFNGKPVLIWIIGRVRSLWFFDRNGDPHLRVNIGVTLHSAEERAVVNELFARARPRAEESPATVYAARICSQRGKGEYCHTATAFTHVYDATTRLTAKSAMPQLSPVDLGKNDIVVIECNFTRWKRAGDGKGKKSWGSYDVGFELNSVFLLHSAPADLEEEVEMEVQEDIRVDL